MASKIRIHLCHAFFSLFCLFARLKANIVSWALQPGTRKSAGGTNIARGASVNRGLRKYAVTGADVIEAGERIKRGEGAAQGTGRWNQRSRLTRQPPLLHQVRAEGETAEGFPALLPVTIQSGR